MDGLGWTRVFDIAAVFGVGEEAVFGFVGAFNLEAVSGAREGTLFGFACVFGFEDVSGAEGGTFFGFANALGFEGVSEAEAEAEAIFAPVIALTLIKAGFATGASVVPFSSWSCPLAFPLLLKVGTGRTGSSGRSSLSSKRTVGRGRTGFSGGLSVSRQLLESSSSLIPVRNDGSFLGGGRGSGS